jgi:hypothetical protein
MSLNANVVVNIAVDAALVYSSQPGSYEGAGIYMMDTNIVDGSQGEGGLELTTAAEAGQTVAFNVIPINSLQNNGASVTIDGMEQLSGVNVFGNQGWPSAQTPGTPYQFLGTLMRGGDMTYRIKIGVTTGSLFPVQSYTWDPHFSVTG